MAPVFVKGQLTAFLFMGAGYDLRADSLRQLQRPIKCRAETKGVHTRALHMPTPTRKPPHTGRTGARGHTLIYNESESIITKQWKVVARATRHPAPTPATLS